MTDPTLDLDRLRQWIGRAEEREDVLDPRPLRLAASILPEAGGAHGDPIGPLRHWFYHLGAEPLDQLGPDGHPARGGFLPPVGLPKRMWAGGRLDFIAPLRIGERVLRRREVSDIQMKQGQSGPLCFVTTRACFSVAGETRLVEERDLVYRGESAPRPPEPAPERAERRRVITPSSTLLFRYSALTFNGHRIHYDLDYCRRVERYPHLVVHGPLLATLLADLAAGEGPLRRFDYRARAPLFADAPFEIAGRAEAAGATLWAAGPTGGLAMTARAAFGG